MAFRLVASADLGQLLASAGVPGAAGGSGGGRGVVVSAIALSSGEKFYLGLADGRLVALRLVQGSTPAGELETRARVDAVASVVLGALSSEAGGGGGGGSGSGGSSGSGGGSFVSKLEGSLNLITKSGQQPQPAGGGGGSAYVAAICVLPARECIAALSDAAGVTLHYARGALRPVPVPGTKGVGGDVYKCVVFPRSTCQLFFCYQM
jgi:hypothetical protein